MKSSNRRYWLGCGALALFILIGAITILVLVGPTVGNVFSNISTSLEGEYPVGDSPPDPPILVEATNQLIQTSLPLTLSTVDFSEGDDTNEEPIVDDASLTAVALEDRPSITPSAEPVLTMGAGVVTTPIPSTMTSGGSSGIGGGGGNRPDTTDVPFASASEQPDSQIIGNGSAFVFHDDEMMPDDRMLIELQVFFDEFYITATPTSAVTAIPASDLARPEIDPQATMTPRSARFSDGNIDLPERLIAWLDCQGQFEGCGNGGELFMRIQSINSWRWTIRPTEGATGSQNLRVELWTVDDDGERNQRIWLNDFAVTVTGDLSVDNNRLIIGGLVAIVVVLISGIGFSRWQSYRKTRHNRPTVFISYRRKVSAGFGRTIRDALEQAGADVFIDINDIHAGSFSDYIKDNIRERTYFMVLLTAGTLDSDWVRQEILYAQEHNRTIIPILLNDFDLYGDELPDNLTFLQQQNAVTIPVEHFDSAMNRIKVFIGLR